MIFGITILFTTYFALAWGWEALPQIPSGRRSQFLVMDENGGYKYGYDTGDGNAAKQTADASNQVHGHYFYTDKTGQKVDVKYTAGIQGFVPEGLDNLQVPRAQTYEASNIPAASYSDANKKGYTEHDDEADSGDASYSFGFDTGTYKRLEQADARGNTQGSYSYNNEAGTHDLHFISGSNTGFVATSGSLSIPNGLGETSQAYSPQIHSQSAAVSPSSDGSYSYSFDTTGEANARAQLHHSVSNSFGTSSTGNYLSPANEQSEGNVGDASYNFSIDTDEYKRHEASDASGNVKGSYSYKNSAGTHDLSYVAGSDLGFSLTGGSLSKLADGSLSTSNNVVSTSSSRSNLGNSHEVYLPPPEASEGESGDNQANTGDSSYSFSIDTDEYKRQEVSDANGNIQGHFSYKNAAGDHGLHYIAGSDTGFVATGGSLKNPPGLSEVQLRTGAAQSRSSNINSSGFSSNSFSSTKSSNDALSSKSFKFAPPAPVPYPESKTAYGVDNYVVRSYLPPQNDKRSFGYVFVTKH